MTHRADIYDGDLLVDQRYLDVDDMDQALALASASLDAGQTADVYAREHDGIGGAYYVATVGAGQ